MRTETPCGTGLCVDVFPSYETVIGTSAMLSPLFDALSKISVETDIPSSVGWITSIAFFEYTLNPDWESDTLKFVPKFEAEVIILIPVFL